VDKNSSARKEEGDGAELMELEAGIGATVELRDVSLNDVGNGLHGSFLHEEHLALVFELRGHMEDLEHRALLMDSVWTCSLMRTPMLQLIGIALSPRRHLPSRLDQRGR
jgi:hypothetical protein